MRRLVTLFFVCLLSLQATWVVAAAYAGHVSPAAQAHHSVATVTPGQAAAVAEDLALGDAASHDSMGVDCHLCHSCTLGMVSAWRALPEPLATPLMHPEDERLPPSAPLHEPERPDWRRLA